MSLAAPVVLFSRYEHGARPVAIYDNPDGKGRFFALEDYEGGKAIFTTARGLLSALTGHPKGRNWTFDRYFKTSKAPGHTDVLGLFGTRLPQVVPVALAPRLSTSLTVEPRTRPFLRQVPTIVVDTSPPLGIDLAVRGGEVARLFYACFGSKVAYMGFEAEDVLQEVYRGLLARNEGVCPFDERKASFGHYVHMVIRCVLSNFRRKQFRIREVEQIGMVSVNDKETLEVDASTWAAEHATAPDSTEAANRDLLETQRDLVTFIHDQGDGDTTLMVQAIPLLQEGLTRKEMASRLGVSRTTLARVVRTLKHQAEAWCSNDVVLTDG